VAFWRLRNSFWLEAMNMHNTHVENPDGLQDIEVWLSMQASQWNYQRLIMQSKTGDDAIDISHNRATLHQNGTSRLDEANMAIKVLTLI
jgi:hypothetical protein